MGCSVVVVALGCGDSDENPGMSTDGGAADSSTAEGGDDSAASDAPQDGPVADAGDDAAPDAGDDALPPDASDDAAFDAPMDVAMDVPLDVAMDVPLDVAIDVPQDVTPDVPLDVALDVPQDVTPDVPLDVALDAPGGCAPGDLVAPVITPTSQSGGPPTMSGGTIVDGIYWAIAETKYNSAPAPSSAQNQITVSNGGLHYAEISDQGTPIGILHLEYDCTSSSPSGMNCQVTCSSSPFVPVGTPLAVTYTAQPTQLQMLNSTTLWTYEKH